VRVEGHVVPAVPRHRLVGFAVPLRTCHERPLLVELDFIRRRGKSDPLVVQEVGVIAGGAKVPGDDVAVDADEEGRPAGADALGHVVEDGRDRVGRQPGVEQGRALALGEAGVAGVRQRSIRVWLGPHRAVTVRFPWPRFP